MELRGPATGAKARRRAPWASRPAWQTATPRATIAVLVIIAVALRAHGLAGHYDYDSYDEGVYWQTLRAMTAGHALYSETFFSQPPFFLLSLRPFYALLGSSITAARAGVAVLSLIGLAGAYGIGRALGGRAAAVAALAVTAISPVYLAWSQRLESEGAATALLFLCVGAAFLWWEHPTGAKGVALAAVSGVAMSLGVLSKLLDVTAAVPLGLLVVGRVWQLRHEARPRIRAGLLPIGVGIGAALVTSAIVLAPFLGSWHPMLRQVVAFHLAAQRVLAASASENPAVLARFFAANTFLTAAAVAGGIIALLRRDWRAVPPVAWAIATLVLLLLHAPLFSRHELVMVPPLVAMMAVGLRPPGRGAVVVGVLALAAVLGGAAADAHYYREPAGRAPISKTRMTERLASDLQRVTTAGEWVITDAQFAAALAGRDTPPWLVDTSMVRIMSGCLKNEELIRAASDPRVHAVLFATDRLTLAPLGPFRDWVAGHFRPIGRQPPGVELWVR